MRESPGLTLERALWQKNIQPVGGMDEAGRGAWAGPVVAALVILPEDEKIESALEGVRDSKQMTPRQRARAALKIKSAARAWSLGQASAAEIDSLGILPATRLAFLRAVESCLLRPAYFLLDYLPWPDCPLPGARLVRGESQSLSIAAASVLAKTARDEIMLGLEGEYPGYGFARHKGYGTAFHRRALGILGESLIHRRSFHWK
ncbi:MAG: ribonuclease HII [Anaerolineales bacterium]